MVLIIREFSVNQRILPNHLFEIVGCSATLNSTNQGIIMSPGYDINGTFSYSCKYKLGVDQGSKLNFSMSDTMGSAPEMYVSIAALLS